MRKEGTAEISTVECWELLRSVSVGRLALSMSALPAILPVQYYLDGNEIAACLGHYTVPNTAIDGTVVAFAVDDVGSRDTAGWTVQVQGTVSLPRASGVPVDCGQPTAGQIVHIAPVVIEGHRIHLCPFVEAQRKTMT